MQFIITALKKQEARKWLWLTFSTLLIGLFIVISTQFRGEMDGRSELLKELDDVAARELMSFRTPSLNGVAIDVTALGSFTVLTLLVAAFFFHYFFTKQHKLALQVFAAGAGSGICTYFLKIFFSRMRPAEEYRLVDVHGFSYPSGHSLSAAAVYFTLALILLQKAQTKGEKIGAIILFGTLITCIGMSRIYLGAHFFSDVTAGILMGIAWASFVGALMMFTVKESST